MTSDPSHNDRLEFQDLSDAEFFALMKQELGDIKKQTDDLRQRINAFLDKAKEKKLLTDILDNY